MSDKELKKPDKDVKKPNGLIWAIKVFFIALFLSIIFGTLSETVIEGANLVVALIVLVVLILISIFFDLVGVAVAVCDSTAFFAMATRKVKGAKMCLKLINKADKVSSICNDIIGDICGILSGALGAAIMLKLSIQADSILDFIMPILISALIAGFTVGGKAFGKGIAIKHCQKIVFMVGKFLSIFSKK